jgi:hypothetical protein
LGRNLGYRVEGVEAFKDDSQGFAEGQRRAWSLVREAIDAGVPCYGWELEIPEYYVVYGYDETGYHYSGPGCVEGKGAKPWRELADSDIGVLEMFRVGAGDEADAHTVVTEALTFALEHSRDTERWVLPDYSAGLAGYARWIDALQAGRADSMGMAYNAAVWNECRCHAVNFLQEVQERLGDGAAASLAQARTHYQVVSDHLNRVADLFPFHGMEPHHVRDEERVTAAIEALRAAKEAESRGLETLGLILEAL